LADAARTDFPDDLVKAVVSIEDRHFFDHPGFDPQGILRALQRNITAGTIVEGGSTITQQLVKMRFLGHERTLIAAQASRSAGGSVARFATRKE
jgi:membrane peptidoglycan carboxypeptidase